MANAFTQRSVFELGFAYGSFSVDQLDQGIHIVIPTTDGENSEFVPLFENYLDKLVARDLGDATGEVYMGAIQAFCRDSGIDIGHTHFIEAFEAAIN